MSLGGLSPIRFSYPNVPTNRGLGYFHFRHLRSDPAPDPMCGVSLLPGCLLIRFQNRIDEGHHRPQFRSLSNRCLAFYGTALSTASRTIRR